MVMTRTCSGRGGGGSGARALHAPAQHAATSSAAPAGAASARTPALQPAPFGRLARGVDVAPAPRVNVGEHVVPERRDLGVRLQLHAGDGRSLGAVEIVGVEARLGEI